MKHLAVVLGSLLYGILSGALPGLGADAGRVRTSVGDQALATKRPSVLAEVVQLERRVSYAEKKIPLGELLQKVSADTGVVLRAAREVADEPVAVMVTDLSARELLEEMAALLDYQWSRRTGPAGTPEVGEVEGTARRGDAARSSARPVTVVYEIWQGLASHQREEALRQAAVGDSVERLREELRRYGEIAALPPEEIRRLAEAGDRRQEEINRMPPEKQMALLQVPKESAWLQRTRTAQSLESPITRVLADLLGRVTPPQWEVAVRDGSFTFSTDPQAGDGRLPAEMVREFRSAQPTLVMPERPVPDLPRLDPASEALLRRHEKEIQDQWSAAIGFQVKIRVDAGFFAAGALHVTATVAPICDRSQAPTPLLTGNETTLAFMALPASPTAASEQDAAERLAALERDPLLSVKKLFKPDAKPWIAAADVGGLAGWRLGDVLPDLARVYGVQFIADAYWAADPDMLGSLPRQEVVPLYVLLDRFAGKYQWDRHGSLIRLRSRTWFYDRPREIPLRFVRRWQAVCMERGALPLEEYVAMATALTDEQLRALSALTAATGLPREIAAATEGRHALRLYASLSAAQRQALQHGRPLPVAQMTLRQRELFLFSLRERDRTRPSSLDLSRWGAGSLSMLREAPHSRASDAPGPASGHSLVPVVASARERANRHPIGPSRFKLWYAPSESETVSLLVASPS